MQQRPPTLAKKGREEAAAAAHALTSVPCCGPGRSHPITVLQADRREPGGLAAPTRQVQRVCP